MFHRLFYHTKTMQKRTALLDCPLRMRVVSYFLRRRKAGTPRSSFSMLEG